MELHLRLEEQADRHSVEALTRAAFWRQDRINEIGVGCDEHYLAHTLRDSDAFVPELDYVAELDRRVVGNIMYTKAWVEGGDGTRREVLTFGPLSVLPAYQGRGVGAALTRHTLRKAAELGFGGVVIFGHPTYYPRFGFRQAGEYGITTSEGETFPAFLALELVKGGLAEVKGRLLLSPLFEVDLEKAAEFDRLFAAKRPGDSR